MSVESAHVFKHTPLVPLVSTQEPNEHTRVLVNELRRVIAQARAEGANGHTLPLVSELRQVIALARAEGLELSTDAAAELLAADRRLRAAYESPRRR